MYGSRELAFSSVNINNVTVLNRMASAVLKPLENSDTKLSSSTVVPAVVQQEMEVERSKVQII